MEHFGNYRPSFGLHIFFFNSISATLTHLCMSLSCVVSITFQEIASLSLLGFFLSWILSFFLHLLLTVLLMLLLFLLLVDDDDDVAPTNLIRKRIIYLTLTESYFHFNLHIDFMIENFHKSIDVCLFWLTNLLIFNNTKKEKSTHDWAWYLFRF